MVPDEIDGLDLELPELGDGEIVCITGNQRRHERFALRLQQKFGARVRLWYQVVGPEKKNTRVSYGNMRQRLGRLASEVRYPRKFAARVKKSLHYRIKERSEGKAAVEEQFFASEINRLRGMRLIEPKCIENPNCKDVLDEVRDLGPFFLLTLGGPIYKKRLLDLVRGLPLNQHDGWCPDYRGAGTVDWALYHRDLRRFGNTVHVTTSGMDAGPILRRSQPCLVPWDSPYSCFLRNVVVGTELMCEVVEDIIDGRSLKVYPQPETQGRTFVVRDLKETVTDSIRQDFARGWLGQELKRLKGDW